MTVDLVAEHVSVGLVLVRDGAVEWVNGAARGLVGEHGGTVDHGGTAHGGTAGDTWLVDLLQSVRPGSRHSVVRWPSPDGGVRWWHVTCGEFPGQTPGCLYEITDETARLGDFQDVEPASAQWRLTRLEAMAGMGSWTWHLVDDRIEWSESLLVLFGFAPGAAIDYLTYRNLVHPDDIGMIESTLTDAIRAVQPFGYTHRMRMADLTTERVFECYGEVFADATGVPTQVLGTARDITEQFRAREELAYLAGHDPLTGIANRRRITGWLADSARGSVGAVLLLLDIDNFKDINDLRGHAVGDQVIRRIARSVATRIGPEALLGRLGGDEFAVVLPGRTAAYGIEVAEQLCDDIAVGGFTEEAPGLRVTVSIGVSPVVPGQDAEVSLAQADLAMYEAKHSGRNRARLFAPDQYTQAVRRVTLLQRVGAALDDDTMQLDAQPIVDLATGRAERYELLVRLRDGVEPELRPEDFLPAAERTDLVLRLDRWVLRRAVLALATPWARAAGLRLEVNVSARSLEDVDFGCWVLQVLKEEEVNPRRLGLEITETAAIGSLAAARPLADRLTQAGCGFALDDFGAGFASFAYLKQLPFTSVKIAGEFVRQLDDDPVDRALVSAVVGVAQQLGMRTVAEHVDRRPLLHELHRLGVDDAQGFYLGTPRPLAELLAGRAPVGPTLPRW